MQKPYPPILLGGHTPKVLERVARTYDGWMPLVADPESFKAQVKTLRKLTAEQGRDPDTLHITAFVDPGENGPSTDELKRYADAGARRIVLFSQKTAIAIADGAALDLIKRFQPVVERARHVH